MADQSVASTEFLIPETKVLAIASHVVYGYVGNKIAGFVLQSLGCDVSSLNTVQFSNHTAYTRWKGTKSSGEEIRDIYEGLKQNGLNDFDMLLTGYAPSAETVEVIGGIGRDLKSDASMRPGSFFWVLDPVMGDQGKLYVDESVVPVYKSFVSHADLILPNQFELETLADTKCDSFPAIASAIASLHKSTRIPHVIVTSVTFDNDVPTLSVIGSSRRSDSSPRLFRIDAPSFPCFFSGTGDLFASLMVVRFREAAIAANLSNTQSWLSSDDAEAESLPLARAAEKVMSSMHRVLEKTMIERDREVERMKVENNGKGPSVELGEKKMHLRMTKATEVRVVRNVKDLREGKVLYKAKALDVVVV